MNTKPNPAPGAHSRLFAGLQLGALALANRIVIAPMCQYSADAGSATDWHLIHLGQLALSGAGLLIIEATAVVPEGRITPGDLGLYNDANEAALARVLDVIRRYSPVPVAIQLAHAGRKASMRLPWQGGTQIPAVAPDGWRAVDVLLDGSISRVAVQRSDFRKLLDPGDASALIASLEKKVSDLSGGALPS